MALSINTNLNALTSARNLAASETDLSRALQRLSSGLRINSARDDAAGLAISERFTTQIRGLNQATRNANDGISMLQTAEGALSTVTDSLQRIRELAVQAANASNSESDRQAIQLEVEQLTQEIDRVGRETSFNGEKVFGFSEQSVVGDPDQLAVIDGLQSGWLSQAESLIQQYFGITADGASISIELTTFTDGAGGVAAQVVGAIPGSYSGKASNVTLQIDMADFVPPNLPDGGSAPFYNDRIIAHEMVHAVMYRSMNIGSMFNPANDQRWFLEGTAEFIQGADERLAASIGDLDNPAAGIANLVSIAQDFGATNGENWVGDSDHYSAAYAAVRYLHQEIKASGGDGIKDVMEYLNANQNATLSDAIAAVTDYADADAFNADFAANAATFLQGLIDSGSLSDADTGAIGGFNVDGGDIRTAQSVILNVATRSGEDQLAGFAEAWEAIALASASTSSKTLQVGANVGQSLDVSTSAMNGIALDIMDADLVNNANQVIAKVDRALNYVNSQRAELGAQLNRLESTIANLQTNSESLTASRSRIQDADYAQETASLTRSQILQQAGVAMTAQANIFPQIVMTLLG